MSTVIDNARFRKLLRAYPKKAIRLLYDLYYKSLLNLAVSLTHDEIASEDIIQEAFLDVWMKRVELCEHHDCSFEHYLISVVRNKSITHYKKRIQKNMEYTKLVKTSPNGNESPVESIIIQTELANEIRKVIATFPRAERECILMNIDQEMTIDQIAGHKGITRKAVERSITSARKRLRKWYNK